MDLNTHSASAPGGFGAVVAALDGLAGQDPAALSAAARAERVLGLRRLLDRLEGHWLHELATLDAQGAAGADPAPRPPPRPADRHLTASKTPHRRHHAAA